MHLQVVTYPSQKVFEGSIDPSMKVIDVINHIGKESKLKDFDVTGRYLIVDRNQQFHRIPEDDAVNRYYDGRQGELYRIEDGSSTRYRYVTAPIPISKDKGKPKEKLVTDSMYALAYDTLLAMLADRGCNQQVLDKYLMPHDQMKNHFKADNLSNITIPSLAEESLIINKRKRAVYVFFLRSSDKMMISRRYAALREYLVSIINEIIPHYNSIPGIDKLSGPIGEEDILEESPNSAIAKFAEKIEVIVIYNNPAGGTEITPGIPHKFMQMFAVQNLSFNVTKHVDQPSFTLLDEVKDRDEIRDMYAINGRTLDPDETLSVYNLREGARLILI